MTRSAIQDEAAEGAASPRKRATRRIEGARADRIACNMRQFYEEAAAAPLTRDMQLLLHLDEPHWSQRLAEGALASPRDVTLEITAILPALRLFARALIADADDADALVHQAVGQTLAAPSQTKARARLRPEMLATMREVYYARRRPSERRGASSRESASSEFDVFKSAYAQMNVEQREVLTLVVSAGCSYEEAAEICQCALGTIKSRTFRARRRLNKLMDAYAAESARSEAPELSGTRQARGG